MRGYNPHARHTHTHTFICLVGLLFYGYVIWAITADVSGSELPFNLSIYTCLPLMRAWNSNVINTNANQRLTESSAGGAGGGDKAPVCVCALDQFYTPAPPRCPLLKATMAFAPSPSAHFEKTSVGELFLQLLSYVKNHCWTHSVAREKNTDCRIESRNVGDKWKMDVSGRSAAPIKNKRRRFPYHVDLLVLRLRPGEADNLSLAFAPLPFSWAVGQKHKGRQRSGPSRWDE